MALNQKATQWVAGGLIAGVLITLVIQWVMGEYQTRQAEQGVIAFTQGYQNAADKQAFVHGYDWNGDGLAVNLSSSSAYDGDSSDCEEIKQQMLGIYEMKALFISWALKNGISPDDPEFIEMSETLTGEAEVATINYEYCLKRKLESN